MSINHKNSPKTYNFVWKVINKHLTLHRVFHSIRFKVNKGWVTAVTLFLFQKMNFVVKKVVDSYFFSYFCFDFNKPLFNKPN